MAATQAAVEDVVISGDGLTWYDATDEVQYGFCGTCGSTMFWRTAARPDRISIAAGTLTPPTGLETIGTIYRNYASDYHVFDESVPNHGEDFPEVR